MVNSFLKIAVILLLMSVSTIASEIPIKLGENSTIVTTDFSEYNELKVMQEDADGHRRKSIWGSFWRVEYQFVRPQGKKLFLDQVLGQIKQNRGEVLFKGRDYVHYSLFVGEQRYYGRATFKIGGYVIDLVEDDASKKIVMLGGKPQHSIFTEQPMVPLVVGYEIDQQKSIYKAFDKHLFSYQEIQKALEGKYWHVVYKQKSNSSLKLPPFLIISKFKDELHRLHGKVLHESKKELFFTHKKVTGVLRFVGKNFTVTVIEENTFEQSLDLSFADSKRMVIDGILFKSSKATLQHSSYRVIAKIATMMKNSPSLKIEIQGHTDNVGAKETNKRLSKERAQSVKDALIDLGVDSQRLMVKGLGDTKPLVSNSSSSNRAKNRRVELVKVNENSIVLSFKAMAPFTDYKREIFTYKEGKISKNMAFNVQGKEERIQYFNANSKTQRSAAEIIKNYEVIISKLKGNIVFKTEHKLYFHFAAMDDQNEVYGRLSVFPEYYYISFIYPKKRSY